MKFELNNKLKYQFALLLALCFSFRSYAPPQVNKCAICLHQTDPMNCASKNQTECNSPDGHCRWYIQPNDRAWDFDGNGSNDDLSTGCYDVTESDCYEWSRERIEKGFRVIAPILQSNFSNTVFDIPNTSCDKKVIARGGHGNPSELANISAIVNQCTNEDTRCIDMYYGGCTVFKNVDAVKDLGNNLKTMFPNTTFMISANQCYAPLGVRQRTNYSSINSLKVQNGQVTFTYAQCSIGRNCFGEYDRDHTYPCMSNGTLSNQTCCCSGINTTTNKLIYKWSSGNSCPNNPPAVCGGTFESRPDFSDITPRNTMGGSIGLDMIRNHQRGYDY